LIYWGDKLYEKLTPKAHGLSLIYKITSHQALYQGKVNAKTLKFLGYGL